MAPDGHATHDDFDSWVAPLLSDFHRIACNVLKDWNSANDATQDALFLMWKHRAKCGGNFRAWGISILLRVCFSYRRRGRRLLGLSEPDRVEDVGTVDPALAFERHTRWKRLKQEIDALPARFRTVLTLHYFEGLTCREIAEIEEGTVDSFKKDLQRGREHLRERLGQGFFLPD
jgi:RNA polymerase sigma-70 factor (ECF subfamily)